MTYIESSTNSDVSSSPLADEVEPLFVVPLLEDPPELLFFVQIKTQVCVADIVLHGLSPPFQAHISQRFVTFGGGADVINDGDS